MSNLRSTLENSTAPDISSLSLMHTANGEDFTSILFSRKIMATQCKVFSPDLLCYFFLGRPAYKTSLVRDPSFWQLPAIFALDLNLQSQPKRLFPFDSGAFELGKYTEILGRIDREKFILPGDFETAAKTIEYFFGNVKRHLDARALPYESISDRVGEDLSSFPALALSKLYNHPYNESIDDRVKLIEVQFDCDILLSNKNLKGVIIYKEWLRDKKIESALENFNCKINTYPILPLSTSNYYSKIYELAGEL